jgi:hypothetical protein
MDKVARSMPAINTVIGSKCARAEQEAHNQTSPTINMLIIHGGARPTRILAHLRSESGNSLCVLLFIEINIKNRIQ